MSPEGDKRKVAARGGVTLLFRAFPAKSRVPADCKRELKLFGFTLSERVGNATTFTCLITGDEEMRRLNRDFLGHDYATDVLSFPAARGKGGDLGEIAISLTRAQAQAEEFGHTCLDEIRVLMLHGFLHLTGLDHERDGGAMARAERKWKEVLGLPSTLIARGRSASGARK